MDGTPGPQIWAMTAMAAQAFDTLILSGTYFQPFR